MLAFNSKLHNQPTPVNISGLINSEIENKQLFKELEHYNKTAEFLYIHPLTIAVQQVDKLRAMRRHDPQAFMNESVNSDKNITRYKSMIKNKKYKDAAELADWQKLLSNYEMKSKLIIKIVSE